MRIASEEKKELVKNLRRELKEEGYNLSSTKDSLKLFPYPNDKSFSLIVTTKLYEIFPCVEIILDSSRKQEQFSYESMDVLRLFVRSIKNILSKSNENNFRLKLTMRNRYPAVNKIEDDFEEIGLYMFDKSLYSMSFVNVECKVVLKSLIQMDSEITEKYKKKYDAREISYFERDELLPVGVNYKIQDVIDRKISIGVDFADYKHFISFRSPHHNKKVQIEEMNLINFDYHYELFVREEKLKGFFQEPVMNNSIKNRLSNVIKSLYNPKATEKDLFDYLLRHYDLEELTRFCLKTFQSNGEIKTGKFNENFEKENASRTLRTTIYFLWDIYLVVFEEEINYKYATSKKFFEFMHFEVKEDALIEEKKWYINKMDEVIDFAFVDDI